MSKYEKYLALAQGRLKELVFYLPKDRGVFIGLPNKFVAPSSKEGIFANDQFYWDSYFIILGLLAAGQVGLAKGMVDNFAYLQKRFGIIPNRNRFFNLGISQPPFLSSMTREVYDASPDKRWLAKMAAIIENELKTYWMNGSNAERHLAHAGLSRYCDHYINHVTAIHESGWDMTSRFHDHCLNYLPVDLNSLLYKYESDLADFFAILGNKAKSKKYSANAQKRKRAMVKLMWNEKKKFFFDYNYKHKTRDDLYTLAGFFPLWAGLATPDQAKKARGALKIFEHKWGLANTQKTGLAKNFRQWDYPNGWANLQWIVIKGLMNYGFDQDARRLAQIWVGLTARIFDRTDDFWEKYNVVAGNVGKSERYPNQKGFGWTNAIFVKLIKEFDL